MLSSSKEPGNARRGLHHMPDIIIQVHLDQDVAWKERPLDGVLLAVTDLSDRLSRDDDFADLFLQSKSLYARFQRLTHLALEPRIGVDDVPLEIRVRNRACASRFGSLP